MELLVCGRWLKETAVACCRRSVAVEETKGAEDLLKWGELGLGCSVDCSGEREGRSAEKEKRSAAGGGIRSLQAEGEARRRRRGWRADRRCCCYLAAAATDSEECGSVAAEAPVEARGEIGCGDFWGITQNWVMTASIYMQGDREYEVASQEFNFSNCLQLDQNSRTRIMGDARLRIQRMATSLFYQPLRVRLCIPGSEVPECFSYKNREGSSVKIRQPAHWHRGFTLCAVVSFGQSGERRPVNIECECHLINKDGTQIDLSSYNYDEYDAKVRSTIWEREHVFIWSVHCKCFFKEASFHFKPLCGATDVVVECGVHPLLK
uniref:C-JID domain-containing protein n=1 Tax=Populus trichocarpa TaxID=3694 RepID=A0A2K1R8N9_POPTR